MRLRFPWLAVVALAACTGEAERAPSAGPEALSETGSIAPSFAPPELGTLPAEPETVLDRRDDGAVLYGTVLAAPRDGDPDRVIALRAEGVLGMDGRRVLDARFVDGGVVSIGVDHVLRFRDADGVETELDAGVAGPLSIARTRVAYVRGEMPFYELARADVHTGEVTALTDGLAPVWSPALSADGSEVVFASSASGQPTLVRLAADGTITTLRSARTPSSPHAPRWEGGTLSFEDELGPVTLDLAVSP